MATLSQTPDPRISWPAGQTPQASIVFTQNTIDIAAPPEVAWSVLVDCVPWPNWYRRCSDVSIVRGGPRLEQGSVFRFKTLGLYFEPEVVTCQPPHRLVWTARGPMGTGGAHAWHIAPTPGGCRVVTEKAQQGWLLRLVRRRTERTLLSAHQEWLEGLKRLAEARQSLR